MLDKPTEFYAKRVGMQAHEALGWHTAEAQHANFRHLVALAVQVGGPLAGQTVHDAGCGHGDLIPYLRAQHIGGYVGSDFMAEPLVIARQKWAGEAFPVQFVQLDLLRGPLPEVDVSFLAGTLAYHQPDDVETILERVWACTRRTIAFHSWWGVPREYAAYRITRETQRRIENFMRRRGKTRARLLDYGPSFEALFALSR